MHENADPAARDPREEPPHPADTLATVVVEYADGPDRWTIHPRGADDLALMATWLTADRDAFVDLGDAR